MSFAPLVSIMMPAYNAESTILRALHSLQKQTYINWECIVVNDGSTDQTSKKVNSLKDRRIHLIELKRNMGRGFARQTALDKCKGMFIGMLDADDWYYPDKLELQIDTFINYPEVDLVSCLMAAVDKEGHLIGIRGMPTKKPLLFNLPSKVPMPHASTLIRSSAVGTISYDPTLKLGQDMDFLRRVLLGKKYFLINEVGYVYEEGYSNSFIKSFKSYYYSAKSYSKFFIKHPLFISVKIILEIIKALRLAMYSSMGLYKYCIHRRSKNPTLEQYSEYKKYKLSLRGL